MKNRLEEWENKLAQKLVKYTSDRQGPEIGTDQYEKRLYGAKCVINNIEKTIIVFPIALLLGVLPYALTMGISMSTLRRFSFGVHMRSSLVCLLEGLIIYLGGGLLVRYWPHHILDVFILFIPIMFSINEYAPAQTLKRPIPEGTRDFYTSLCRSIGIFWSFIASMLYVTNWLFPIPKSIHLDAFGFSIMLGLFVQAIHLTPVMFRLFERAKPPII